MIRVLLIIVILYVAFGVWVISELPAPDPIVPAKEYVPEAGSSAGEAGVPELMAPASLRVTTQN